MPDPKKRPFNNRLNDLDPKGWIKFQKSWFLHNPPARRKEVLRHPAKFPETLAQEFIQFFTKAGETVLDPMAGTGSALVAALRAGRSSYGVELNPIYMEIACGAIVEERQRLGADAEGLASTLVQGDAARIQDLAREMHFPPIAYVITSPPYWDMLHARGSETQRGRRAAPDLDVQYSEDPADLGNIRDYGCFLETLSGIYRNLAELLIAGSYLTIIVKNIKKGGEMYPLAWDLARSLGEFYTLKDEKIWVQDNQRLAPYGMGSAWVSNTFHHYCLQFRYEP